MGVTSDGRQQLRMIVPQWNSLYPGCLQTERGPVPDKYCHGLSQGADPQADHAVPAWKDHGGRLTRAILLYAKLKHATGKQ